MTLWPTALVSVSSLDVAAVSVAVATVLEHALNLEPCQPSWLRTQADIYYGKSGCPSSENIHLLNP